LVRISKHKLEYARNVLNAAGDRIQELERTRHGLYMALAKITAAAESWHNFHHGSSVISCDSICEALPIAKAALAAAFIPHERPPATP
jgi:hypothetical protein